MLKGIFNKNMLINNFLLILKNILNVPTGFISLEVKTKNKIKIYKPKDLFFYLTLGNILSIIEENSVQFNISISIDVENCADNLIKSFKEDDNFNKIDKKNFNKIIIYVGKSLESFKKKKENFIIYQILLSNIIKKLAFEFNFYNNNDNNINNNNDNNNNII